jgi:hypothetical protein
MVKVSQATEEYLYELVAQMILSTVSGTEVFLRKCDLYHSFQSMRLLQGRAGHSDLCACESLVTAVFVRARARKQRAKYGDRMIRRSLRCGWTEDDRLTRAKWMRGAAIFYGCLALLVLQAGGFTVTGARADENSELL